jgi:hypothetical protein
MRPRDKQRGKALEAALEKYAAHVMPLPGIEEASAREALVEQLVESLRRSKFLTSLSARPISPRRADATDELFDPLRAAVHHRDAGNRDEAVWLIFLAAHFGRNRRHGWALAQAFYNRLGQGPTWNWQRASRDPAGVGNWVEKHATKLKQAGSFGNHRKYETLNASENGTGAIIESYINWIKENGGHSALFARAEAQAKGDPRLAFDIVYRQMEAVTRFGRTGRFDYLMYVKILGLAAIEPGHLYLQGATGPLRGAHLLFGGKVKSSIHRADLETEAAALADHLGVGMNVVEDGLCNWQKSPYEFRPFRG